MTAKIYIDGHAGTTGLQIRHWLTPRTDVRLLTLPEDLRKDPAARQERLQEADIAILCLPDEAALQAARWSGEDTCIIDASTAHRVAPGWVYGLPELCPSQRRRIKSSRRISNPGCYASTFVLLVRPLLDAGLLAPDSVLAVHGLSGYSGGGRGLIEHWQQPQLAPGVQVFEAPYALGRVHKHIAEMMVHAGLEVEPQFAPAIGPFRCGMRVQLMLHARQLNGHGDKVWPCLSSRYASETFVTVQAPLDDAALHEKIFDPQACNGTNRLEIYVVPHPSGHVTLVALLDNLGKGASGMAVQTLNLLLGQPETLGLPGHRDSA